MGTILRRMYLPLLVLIGGAAMLAYGAMSHGIPVLDEHESQVTIEIPSAFQPDGPPPFPGSPPLPGEPQFNGPPPTIKKTVTKIERTTTLVGEPALTREVTVGGVALDKCTIKRTYDRQSGKGPALCPT